MKDGITADLWVRRIGELLTMAGDGRGDLGTLKDAAVAVRDGQVVWVGPDAELERHVRLDQAGEGIDAGGKVVTPGLIDCHTHLVFAGSRVNEMELRARGATYLEIAAQGGGISATVRQTRAASFDELLDTTLRRLSRSLEQGVTTVEIKSGYGLDLETELKILRVAQMAGFSHPVDVVPTFLGAHTIPPEHRADREVYIDAILKEMLPQVAEEGLARFCDVFCEAGAFSLEESRRILTAAKDHGLDVRIHAEQLSRSGGASLAAELGAASADHLEYATDEDLRAMAAAGTVAVLLPGAAFFLGQAFPSARRFLDHGVEVALSTDFNPGSSPTQSILLMGTFGVTRMGLTPAEALRALTVGAARALRIDDRVGRLLPGYAADLVLWDVVDPRALLYNFGENPCVMVLKGGAVAHP